MILIIGGNGNMGKRYSAILRYLDKDFAIADVDTSKELYDGLVSKAKGFIVCTPTDTHVPIVESLSRYRKPILCEKPITKDIPALKRTIMRLKYDRTPFKMVHQYDYLADPTSKGDSHYNYFKTGSDGLMWDCMQIIKHARGSLEIENDSPIWRCVLNGQWIRIADMDKAYIHMIREWLTDPTDDLDMLIRLHERVSLIAEGNKNGKLYDSSDCHPGA